MTTRTNPHDAFRESEALDRYWDALVDPSATGLPPVDPETASAVRRLHQMTDAPNPNPGFVSRLEERLMDQPYPISSLPVRHPAGPSAARASGRASTDRSSPPRAPVRAWRGVIESVLAAALIVAIGAGAILSWGNLPGQGEPLPTTTSGIGAATPEREEEGASAATGMERGNAGRTGEIAGQGPREEPSRLWQSATPDESGWFQRPPVIVDGSAYAALIWWEENGASSSFGTTRGFVTALDAATGSERWRVRVDTLTPDGSSEGAEVSVPMVADGVVYVTVAEVAAAAGDAASPACPTPSNDAVSCVTPDAATTDCPTVATGGAVSCVGTMDPTLNGFVPTPDFGDRGPAINEAECPTPTPGNAVACIPPTEAAEPIVVEEISDVTFHRALVALDAGTGQERWRVPIDGGFATSPVVLDGVIYVAGVKAVQALNAETGRELWRFGVPGSTYDPENAYYPELAVGRDLVYVLTGRESNLAMGSWPLTTLRALDLTTGSERWQIDVDQLGRPRGSLTALAVSENTVFVGANTWGENADDVDPGRFYAFDAATGAERWATDVEFYVEPWTTVDDGLAYVVDNDEVIARDSESGEERWRIDVGDRVGGPLVLADGVLYLLQNDRGLFDTGWSALGAGTFLTARDAATGSERWQLRLPEAAIGEFAVGDGLIILPALQQVENSSSTSLFAYGAD